MLPVGPGCTAPRHSSWNSLGLTISVAYHPCQQFMSPRSTLLVNRMPVARLQKILSRAGMSSRRTAETLIQAGRVRVNGETVTRLGTTADPRRDTILLDGQPLIFPEFLYFIIHKPIGFVSTLKDPEGRPTIRELLR